jgi:ketosteroid isomerase-like protein
MRILLLSLAILLVSCQSPHDPSADKMAIARVMFDQQNAWNEGDIEKYMTGYLRSDSLRFASGGNITYGWQTTLDRYLKGYPDAKTMGKLTFSKIDIRLISKTSALVFGKWELEREQDHPWGLYTLIFEKTNEGWRIVHDHTSSSSE